MANRPKSGDEAPLPQDVDAFRYPQTEQLRIDAEADPDVERPRNASCVDCGAKAVVNATLKQRLLPCPECNGNTMTLLPGWAQEKVGEQPDQEPPA